MANSKSKSKSKSDTRAYMVTGIENKGNKNNKNLHKMQIRIYVVQPQFDLFLNT